MNLGELFLSKIVTNCPHRLLLLQNIHVGAIRYLFKVRIRN